MMDEILTPYSAFCIVYLDDILIFSSIADHAECVKKVFDGLKKYRLYVNQNKCQFGKKAVKFLGYIVSKNALGVDGEKKKTINDFPKPLTQVSLRRFLGMTGYLSQFVRRYAMKTSVLLDMLHNFS